MTAKQLQPNGTYHAMWAKLLRLACQIISKTSSKLCPILFFYVHLIDESENCTIYTLQFLRDIESEFEKFVSKFRDDAEYSDDFMRIATFIKRILKSGASERYFRPEGKMNDSVVALPATSSKLRLYCLRLSDKILILGNGGVKKSQKYEDDSILNGYVMTLQKFEEILNREVANGCVNITESTIETDNIFEL